MFPIPNQQDLWPQFRSPLLWDVLRRQHILPCEPDVLVHGHGARPGHATRSGLDPGRKLVYGILAMGWRGSNRQWLVYEKAYLLLAALSTPLVLCAQRRVLRLRHKPAPRLAHDDFSAYFVRAQSSAVAMVLTLAIPARAMFGLQNIITLHHLENCAR